MVVPAAEAQAILRPLLEARSVAIVGASTRPGSFGNAVVRQMLAGGFAGPVDGSRGTPASSEAAVASAIVRLSALAADVGELISGLDINPLIAGPSGCVAVDVLVAHGHPG